MEEFTKIAELADLREAKGITRKLEDDDIALVKLNETVCAFVNICPHQHTPLVDKYGGQIYGEELTCPMHGWTYDLKTGKCVNESGKLKMLEVKIEDGGVHVRKIINKNDL
ncbi:MAG: Rieske (2Fe-2S) protein [Bacteroidetes bacterium]|nr:Rieske (2Fe-2S) protein [Bacteroidota bacterium]